MSTDYKMVIGLEVHAQLKTNTKLFCGCSTQFGGEVNTNVCPVCLGMPGALPVLNKRAVEMAVMAGRALNCDIQNKSVFSRKNYFYPDLPKGYQISQFDLPICLNGSLEVTLEDGTKKTIGITRIHMEEDAGKLLHQGAEGIAGATHSLVDLNRACTPLIEIVSEPDIRSAEEAKAYVQELRQILRTIGVNDGNLEEGSFRVDINLSLRKSESDNFGTRTEVKNVNSFRSIERAIKSEYKRQSTLLDRGEAIVQQTRNYHDDTQTTTALRNKEDAHDYRYFPEPDLLPLVLTDEEIKNILSTLPDLPAQIKAKYLGELELTEEDYKVLIEDGDMRTFFDAAITNKSDVSAKDIAKWVVGDLNAILKDQGGYARAKVSPSEIVALVSQIKSGKISGKMGKDFLPKLLDGKQTVESFIKADGGGQISDADSLKPIIQEILDANQDVVEKIKAGKTQSANFLMGQVMKATRGKANPDLVKELILELALA